MTEHFGSRNGSTDQGEHAGDLGFGNIMLRNGSIFDSEANTIVITVNCVGVMGKGIALEFRKRYPHLFSEYVGMCDRELIRLGQPSIIHTLLPPSFLMFPTKDHWRSVSRLADIEAGLSYLAEHYRSWGITSLAVPPLGCGHGGLEWAVVGPVLYKGLRQLDIPVDLFPPHGVEASGQEVERLQSADYLASTKDVSHARRTSPPEVVAIVQSLDVARRMRPNKPIGRVLMQKLGYFALVAGIDVPFKFERKPYGPYSTGWNTQIRHLVNNGLLEEQKIGSREAFAYEPGPTFESYTERIYESLQVYEEPVRRLGKLIAQLAPRQAELAATTHMVAAGLSDISDSPASDDDIIAGVQEWKLRRKKPFSDDQVRACVEWLRKEGWLPTCPDKGHDGMQPYK